MNKQIEILRDHYNSESATYDNGYNNTINIGEDKVVTNIIKKYLKNSLLDAGCGTGILLQYIDLKKLDNYVGIDIADDMLAIAQKKFPEATFIKGDMHNLPYPENSFDTVACIYGTFSYSTSPEKLLLEMKRVLKPKGRIIIMPYSTRVEHRILLGYCAKSFRPDLKVNYFSKELLSTITQLKFKIKEVNGINYLGNIFYPVSNFLHKVFQSIPTTGFGYLNFEYKIFRILNFITNNSLVNFGRHIIIVAEKED